MPARRPPQTSRPHLAMTLQAALSHRIRMQTRARARANTQAHLRPMGSKGGEAGTTGNGEPAAKIKRGHSTFDLEGDPPPSAKKARTEVDELLKNAAQVKAYYHQIVGGAQNLISAIATASDPAEGKKGWGWAKTQVHSLQATVSHLKGKLTEMGQEMLITDLGKVRKSTDAIALAAECGKFNELRSDVQKVEFEHQKLLDQNEIQNRDMTTAQKAKKKPKKQTTAKPEG